MADFSLFILNATSRGVDMDGLHIGGLGIMSVISQTSTMDILEIPVPAGSPLEFISDATIFGVGLGYSALSLPLTGSVTGLSLTHYNPAGRVMMNITGITNVSGDSLGTWIRTDDTTSAFSAILAGNDSGHGSPGPDVMHGYGGSDTLSGAGGGDTIYGGPGDDLIYGSAATGPDPADTAPTYLRGDEGNDTIVGTQGFDDINGNQGDDVLHGGAGDDWVVGGRDNDVQFGDAGGDIVWGNLGNDTLDGGDGADQVRGGQGDDSVSGGAGNDFVSGDRGNDTISGGSGADTFHGSQDAGIDRVLDFNPSEGDRVMLDPGTTYGLRQVGADTIIDMGGGNQMILVGVPMSTLTPGWIFQA
ncbi:calcium-binding protein [Phenylobacterium sp.]|uniref:calcium-binding protein n=1 Tax=Phenylobacterium sp. TaxID=1871053 RepID=UPI002E3694E2|nr:calcium-binding protein [Phenylobacterium sp.]HEX4709626.1 calcium-binding protein [Phenylobacterium sp.]